MPESTYPDYKRTRNMIISIVIIALFSFLLMGCSTVRKEVVSTRDKSNTSHVKSLEPRTVVDDNEVNLMTRIDFEPGSSRLTSVSKKRISSALAKAQTLGKVNEVKVLSWADQEYPDEEREKLSGEQKSLAVERNKVVKEYLRTINGNDRIDIYDYNMAQRPNVVSEFFKTSDARVKESMELAGVATTANKRQKSRRASSSLVIINLADSPQIVELNYQTF